MFLNKEEEQMLQGEYGEVVSKALTAIVKVGEVLGADSLIDISHAHVSGISYFNIGDAGIDFIESLAFEGASFRVFTTANPYAVIQGYKQRNFSDEVLSKQLKVVSALRSMGAKAFTCAPYFIRKPKAGEHIAWAESNAVLFANSVLGAYTNREGGPLALFEALTGKAYNAGVHLPEGRKPRCVVEVETPKNYLEAALTGYAVGRRCPSEIPYVKGLKSIKEGMMRSFLAAFGATSGAPMAVLEGVTPGWRKHGEKIKELPKVEVDDSEIRAVIEEGGKTHVKPDLYIIGCPHLSSEELIEILKELSSCRRYEGATEIWLITGRYVSVPDHLNRLNPNIKVLFDVCPVVTRLDKLGIRTVVTDSGKALYYLPKLAKVDVVIKDRYEIISEILRGCG
ncbi:MAG: aconitase X catalytic domain-containing protein [Desulfurococcales archaeon]|nr:aconitase X catalytic domain-containing protein [Desulfurococcales archaeon]